MTDRIPPVLDMIVRLVVVAIAHPLGDDIGKIKRKPQYLLIVQTSQLDEPRLRLSSARVKKFFYGEPGRIIARCGEREKEFDGPVPFQRNMAMHYTYVL